MSNRSEAATSRAGRGLRRFGVAAAALATAVAGWTGQSIDARADTIRLKSGEEIEGAIVDATRNTVVVRRSIGGMRQMRIEDIDEVRIDLARGEEISGEFLGWADGAYQLRAGGEEVSVSEGVISRQESRQATGQPMQEPAPGPEQQPAAVATAPESEQEPPAVTTAARSERRPAAVAPASEAEQEPADGATAPEEPTAVATASESEQEPTAATTAAAAPSASEEPTAPRSEGDNRTVAVKGSAAPAGNGADGMVFKIELSRPAEQPVVLIYGTLDGTAKAGTDYQSQQGVITLDPGTRSGEVRVPLIKPRRSNGEKQFELFLIADPKVAEVVDKRIIATIQGED